jgi:23S rRNA pseudouridine2605 synthase
VDRLMRLRVGGLWLGGLGPGEYRELTSRDLHDLLNPALVPRHAWARAERETLERWG